jgi:glycosyltransferase involved in cell wall biosynthesis
LEGIGVHTNESMKRMVKVHDADQYYFYFDRKISDEFVYSNNVRPTVLWPPARHPVLFRIWFHYRLKKAIEKLQPDVFFSPDSFMPLGMKIPSVITVHDVAHRIYPNQIPDASLKYYDKYLPLYLDEAKHIITVSAFSKAEIVKYYGISKDKISVVYNGVSPIYQPLLYEEKTAIRSKLTGGAPYFLYVGSIHPRKNIHTLIRAFDKIKGSTKSNYKLVIAGRKSWQYEEVTRAYDQAGFKDDILFTDYVPDANLPGIVASAFTLCYPSLYEGFGMPVIEAMACGVPVICSDLTSLPEVCDNAALLADPVSAESFSSQMDYQTIATIILYVLAPTL